MLYCKPNEAYEPPKKDSERTKDAFTGEQVRSLLESINLLRPTKDAKIFQKFTQLLTPRCDEESIFSVRNIRCLVYTIFGLYQKWMSEQQFDLQQTQLPIADYNIKVEKYKLLLTKFGKESAEALDICINNSDFLFDTKNEKQVLTEAEKNFVMRYTNMSNEFGVLFKGKTFCVDKD